MTKKLPLDFYIRDVLEVAPDLLGKKLILMKNNARHEYIITEVEAYRGEEDLACHASKGKTPRTEIMYAEGGYVYMYLIYGMYWMFNIITGPENIPQAALIRGLDLVNGPGRLTRDLGMDRSYHRESLISSDRIWLEMNEKVNNYKSGTRIGINYAGDTWKNKEWRFYY